MNKFYLLLAFFTGSILPQTAFSQTITRPYPGNLNTANPIKLRAPGGGFIGMQLQNSNIANWAGQLSSETETTAALIARTPILPQIKQQLNIAAALAVKESRECHRLALANVPREQILRAHREADVAVSNLISALQQSGIVSRDIAQSVARLQYLDTQLEQAFGHHHLDDGGRRTRIARIASTLADQANELRAISQETVTVYDRELDRMIRRYAFGCTTLEQNIVAGADQQKVLLDVTELDRRWQNLTAGLRQTVTANAALRAQASRVDALHRDLVLLATGNNAAGLGMGIVSRGTAFAVGAGEGGGPRVKVYFDIAGGQSQDFFAYEPEFRGGVRVAMADLTGDGIPDIITAPGPGRAPLVRVFDGRNLSLVVEFLAYDARMIGGVFVAAADMNQNGRAMVVTGADAGATPHVRVFDLASGKVTDDFMAYSERFRGGVRVALGDVNGDGVADLITAPGPSQPNSEAVGPIVRVFDGRNRASIVDFNAYDPRWTNGVWLATGDILKDNRAEIFTGADFGGGPHVRVFDGMRGTAISDLFPFPMEFNGGVRVAVHDVNGDGVLDFLCAPGPSTSIVAPPIRILDGRNKRPMAEFRAFEASFRGGSFIGAK